MLNLPFCVTAALPSIEGRGLIYSRATLVVCAVSLVGQWLDEAVDKTKAAGQQGGSLKLFKYHGPNRDKVGWGWQSLGGQWAHVLVSSAALVRRQSWSSRVAEC